MNKKRAFTLVEILMVVLIVWILVWVLFKVYITISQISFRVEQQKILNKELFFVSETMQNFANRNSIDYSKYNTNLISTNSNGISDVLYLTWDDGEFSIYATGDCLSLNKEVLPENLSSGCNLVMKKWQDGDEIELTHDQVYITKTLFKIVPFMTNISYSENENLCESNYLACTNDPGFWIIMNMYSRWYQQNVWANQVSVFVNQFFNI